MKFAKTSVHERHEKHEMDCARVKVLFVSFRVFRGQKVFDFGIQDGFDLR